MKILLTILMMFLLISCSSTEASTEAYELEIQSLKEQTQLLERKVNLLEQKVQINSADATRTKGNCELIKLYLFNNDYRIKCG